MSKINTKFLINPYTKKTTIAIIILTVGYSIFASYNPDKSNAEISPMLTVNVVQAKRQQAHERRRSYLGRLEARRSSNLGFEISGAIKEIFVQEGETVNAGQPLALLDINHLIAKQEEVKAEVQRAAALYELTRITKERTIEASKYKAVSEIDADQANQNYSAQGAVFNSANARLSQIEIEIGKGILAAPYSGIIARRYVDEGTVVEEGTPVIQIVEVDQLKARIGVNNPRILQKGQAVNLATRNGTVEAMITSILPVRDTTTRNVEIICTVYDSKAPLRPGDAVTLILDENIEEEGLWLPASALTESDRGLWAVYLALPQGEADTYKLARQELEIIDQTTDQVFVRSPIANGTLVVKDGMNRIVPGLTAHIKMSE